MHIESSSLRQATDSVPAAGCESLGMGVDGSGSSFISTAS